MYCGPALHSTDSTKYGTTLHNVYVTASLTLTANIFKVNMWRWLGTTTILYFPQNLLSEMMRYTSEKTKEYKVSREEWINFYFNGAESTDQSSTIIFKPTENFTIISATGVLSHHHFSSDHFLYEPAINEPTKKLFLHGNKGHWLQMMTKAENFSNHLFHDADLTQLFLYWTGMFQTFAHLLSYPCTLAGPSCPPSKLLF